MPPLSDPLFNPIPEHVSYSAINSWLRCAKAYWLERIANAPANPAWWFAAGGAFHLATEDIDNQLHAERHGS